MTTQIADSDELLPLAGLTPDQFTHLARLSTLGSFQPALLRRSLACHSVSSSISWGAMASMATLWLCA